MEENVTKLFAETIKRFLDNQIGMYNMYVVPSIDDAKLFFQMVEVALRNAGFTNETYLLIVDATKSYSDAGINNKEYPDIVNNITKILNHKQQ